MMYHLPDLHTSQEIITYLESLANPENVAGMQRYGINAQNTIGISMPALRAIAKENKRNHTLALELWESGIHEARILASLVDDPRQVTPEQMENWVVEFDSWDVCDQVCGNLFDRTPYAYTKAQEWSRRDEEFVKRAAFALMAYLALHDKKTSDDAFISFLAIISRSADDERNFVKKNRQLGASPDR